MTFLTFDDGPDPAGTPPVLRALARADARASFFVMADRAAAHPHLVAAIRAGGHTVELHCRQHVRHTVAGAAAVAADTREALALLARLGVRPRRWRTPWGDVAPFTDPIAAAHGLTLTGWTHDTHDWRGDPAEAMLAQVAPGLGPGSVVLMHDGVGPGALRRGCATTAALVGPLAELARGRGGRLEPLPAESADGALGEAC